MNERKKKSIYSCEKGPFIHCPVHCTSKNNQEKLKCQDYEQLFSKDDLNSCEDCDKLICSNCQDYEDKLIFCKNHE